MCKRSLKAFVGGKSGMIVSFKTSLYNIGHYKDSQRKMSKLYTNDF